MRWTRMRWTRNRWARIGISLVLGLACGVSRAQTWQEWTEQKKLQTEYKIRELLALQSYRQVLVRGYEIAERGWNAVDFIQNGEFDLHRVSLESRKTAGVAVKQAFWVDRVYGLHHRIGMEKEWMELFLKRDAELEPSEKEAVKTYAGLVGSQSESLIEEMEGILGSGGLELSESDRLRLLEGLEGGMAGLYGKLSTANRQFRALALWREKRGRNKSDLNAVYGNN